MTNVNNDQNQPQHLTTTAPSGGWSMEPIIKPGCKLVIELSQNQTFSRGDIVAYISKGTIMAHRIIKVLPNHLEMYALKGDNNPKLDSPVSKKQIIGKVIKIQHKDYSIFLTDRKHQFMKIIFSIYSCANMKYQGVRFLKKLYKIPLLKTIYRKLMSG